MLFSNPKIIITPADAIVGGVTCNTDAVSYEDYAQLVEDRILLLVTKQVRENQADGMTYAQAIESVASSVGQLLNIESLGSPSSEEEIVEAIMRSDEYVSWDAKIYDRYMSIHPGVVTALTPVSSGGINPTLEKVASEVADADLPELLQALSASYTIQY